MHIRELTLVGFKSFADKATLRFSPGMNAVIGPNGCGKTNILDALRWVLGEQSFTMLRCGKNEDLIFGGTAAMPATNYTEVRLVLANDEGEGPAAEIEIKRRYFRSGESEYYLNRQPCRLRDIQDVFLSSGTGTKAYSIFDLRQMRDIISGNIRKMFEEAANLAKYQDAKAECLRKFALTESDLTRLDDIIVERERVVRSLQRQAGRLKAFDRLKSEEKGLRLVELKAEYDAVKRDCEQARLDTEALEQADAGRLSEIHRLEEELKSQRVRLRDVQALKDELANRVRDQRQAVSDLEGTNLLAQQRIEFIQTSAATAMAERSSVAESVKRLEGVFAETLQRMAQATELQAAAEARLEAARALVAGTEEKLYGLRAHESALRHQLQELLEQQHVLQSKHARLVAEQENRVETGARLAAEIAALRERSGKAGGEVQAVQTKLATVGENIGAARASRATLEAETVRVRAARALARESLARLRDERVELEKELAVLRAEVALDQLETGRTVLGERLLGDIGRFLDIEPGWERACEAALYDVVDFIVAGGEFDPGWLAQLSAARPELRFGILTGADVVAGTAPGVEHAAVVGRLSEHVKVKDGAPAGLSAMVAGVLVCDRAESFAGLAPIARKWALVTRDGACRFPDGRVVLASVERGRLSVGRMIADKSARVSEIDGENARLAAEETGLDAKLDELDRQLSATELGLFESEREKSSLDATLAAVSVAHDELGRDVERVLAEHQVVQAARRVTEEKVAANSAELAELATRIAATGESLKRAEAETVAAEQIVKANLDGSTAALAEQAEARQAVARLESENAFAKRQIDESRHRINAFERGVAEGRAVAEQLAAEITSRGGEIDAARQVLVEFEAEIEKLAIADIARAEEALESNLDELRAAQGKSQTFLMEQRMKLYETTQKAQTMEEEARTSYATDIAAFVPDAAPEAPERLAQLRRRLEALGQVNPLAGEEFAREKGDLERLRVQRQDVAQAKLNLEATLVEIDRHAQEQFVTTYAEVRGHFREIFKELFLEGEADLVLVNDANPLESEIAIVAKPRGKTPKRLEQLSDGEKALLAVSLLFAFYRVKPAPFCFLDEVDAPLDDANVGRFADYLRGIAHQTQVMIITHNRLTVERADVVFGVTAEQPGVSKLVSVSLAEYRQQQIPA